MGNNGNPLVALGTLHEDTTMHGFDSIHYLDGMILAAIGLGLLVGFGFGVVRPLTWFATYTASAYASAAMNGPATEFLQAHAEQLSAGAAPPAAFVGTFFGVYLLLFTGTVAIRRWARWVRGTTDDAVDAVGLRALDRLLGAGIGGSLAALLVGSALLALALAPDGELKAQFGGSQLRPHVAAAAERVLAAIPEQSRAEFAKAVQRLKDSGTNAAGVAADRGLQRGTDQINQSATQLEAIAKQRRAIMKDAENDPTPRTRDVRESVAPFEFESK